MKYNHYILALLTLAITSCGGGGPVPPGSSTTLPAENSNTVEVQQSTSVSKETTRPTQRISDQIDNVKVYVENSGSMYGYVNGNCEFKEVIFHYLSSLQNKRIANNLSLNYINSRIININRDLEHYIHKISVEDFKKQGGSLSSTDLSSIWSKVLDNNGVNDVSILISDCIISPGKGADAEQYLLNQQTSLFNITAQHKNVPMSVIVYKLMSKFDGRYYDPVDHPQTYRGDRPYYMILVGNIVTIAKMRYELELDDAFNVPFLERKNPENIAIMIDSVATPEYAIGVGGCVKRVAPATKTYTMQKNAMGDTFFDIHINLPALQLTDEYVLDKRNYAISDTINYCIESIRIEEGRKDYYYTMRIKAIRLKPENLRIGLIKQIPQWVIDSNDEDGYDVKNNPDKTYGIKYIVAGINEAFRKNHRLYNYECYMTFDLNIKTN